MGVSIPLTTGFVSVKNLHFHCKKCSKKDILNSFLATVLCLDVRSLASFFTPYFGRFAGHAFCLPQIPAKT